MKAYLTILLTIAYFSSQLVHAQHKDVLLKVGDKAPTIKAYKWLKGSKVINFKKGQVYIIDFGATWCVPCAAAIPHLTGLAKKFGNNLIVISVFVMEPKKNSTDSSYVQNVTKYVEKQGGKMEYNVAVDDPKESVKNAWLGAAALNGIPQSFVIDKNGRIAWIGNPNSPVVSRVLDRVCSNSYDIRDAIKASRTQKEMDPQQVDSEKPLFIDGNGGDGRNFLYRSILTYYTGESSTSSDFVYSRNWAKISADRQPYAGMVQQIGAPILKLYYLAYADTIGNSVISRQPGTGDYPDTVKYPTTVNRYGKYWYKPVLEVSDTLSFQFNFQSNSNRYNYSLIVPDEKASAKFLQEAMRRDLKTYFGYDVIVEERVMPYWRIIASENAKKMLKTKTPGSKHGTLQINDTVFYHNNEIMKDILTPILYGFSFGYASIWVSPKTEAPFIDETGITDEIDYERSTRELQEILNGNWDVLLKFLHRHGLDLVKGERLTKVVVIRDPK